MAETVNLTAPHVLSTFLEASAANDERAVRVAADEAQCVSCAYASEQAPDIPLLLG